MDAFATEKPYHRSTQFFRDLELSIESAKSKVLINVYIWGNDLIGERVIEKAEQAAHRGVKVKIIVDGYGSKEWIGAMRKRRIHPNIELRVFHPFPFFKTLLTLSFYSHISEFLTRFNRRDHKKLFIFDDHFFFVGSANLCQESHEQRESAIKTTFFVDQALKYFDYTWSRSHPIKKLFSIKISFTKSSLKSFSLFGLRCNYNISSRRNNNKHFVQSLIAAKNKIWLTTPYFLPHRNLISALLQAAKEGIDIRLLLPAKTDIPTMKIMSRYFYPQLFEAGIRIYEYKKCILHSKISIVDEMVLIGSSNLDYRSLFTNLEVDYFVSSDVIKSEFSQQFLIDLESSQEVTSQQLKNTPLYIRMIANLILIFKWWF